MFAWECIKVGTKSKGGGGWAKPKPTKKFLPPF